MNNMFHDLIKNCPEIQFMPIRSDKTPIFKDWQNTKRSYDFNSQDSIGMVCGSISANLEAIDIDLKYDLSGNLFERFKTAIKNESSELLKKLVVQSTRSGGYHFIYRCSEIEGNKKLARREATETEKKAGEKIKVLLETRGEGGYIACYPTEGYKIVYGSFDKIQTITPEERNILFNVAYQFNEYLEEFKPVLPKKVFNNSNGLSPFEDYNQRADVISLLESHGWKSVGQKGTKILLKRPGDTKARHSGNYDSRTNWFSVFSTSTEFKEETAYLPYAVFAYLECKGDFSEAAKKLYDLGYGERREEKEPDEIKSIIDPSKKETYLIAKREDYIQYLTNWRTGKFEQGLTTGFTSLDKYFLFKKSTLVVINGIDNVGKSNVIWYFAMVSCLYHGWKWILYSSENSIGTVMRKLIEFYWCKGIENMTEQEYNSALSFVEKNFKIIKNDDAMYNYKDIINISLNLLAQENYHAMLIDPYNGLDITLSPSSKLTVHDYHYKALGELKMFIKKTGVSVYINCHAVTGALRMRDDDGYPLAPQKADTEQGGKFANRADDFITIHRKTQHPDEWDITEIHVRKIKETETGGNQTPLNEPVKIKRCGKVYGFTSIPPANVFSTEVITENPVLEWHKRNKPVVVSDKSINSFPAQTDLTSWETLPIINEGEEKAPF
jgi:hypothetical protein